MSSCLSDTALLCFSEVFLCCNKLYQADYRKKTQQGKSINLHLMHSFKKNCSLETTVLDKSA